MTFGDPRVPERIWRKLVVDPETNCWLWTGRKNRNGYAYVPGSTVQSGWCGPVSRAQIGGAIAKS